MNARLLPRVLWAMRTMLCFILLAAPTVRAADTMAAASTTRLAESLRHPVLVRSYALRGEVKLAGGTFASALPAGGDTNVPLARIVQIATDLQRRYQSAGFKDVSIALTSESAVEGVVTFNVFHGAVAQILVDGQRIPTDYLSCLTPVPASVPTNAPVGFLVKAYAVDGNTLLQVQTLTNVLDKFTGTNVTVVDIGKARTALQMEYRDRGYVTVKVGIPPQRLDSNAVVKLKVVEGRLSEINVIHNRYYSSNNVMRSLPSLHTNLMLVEPVFQAELDRANSNPDRQIYPEISPGATEGTTALDLKVKDRLPLHGKLEFNNQNSPGTPDLRLNGSIVYNNLWQLDHSIGIQYGCSPTDFKTPGSDWEIYDTPLVANYGGFYRLPLGEPQPMSEVIEANAGSFGYNEATRKFELPPASGQPELNLFASRSTIDTGVTTPFKGQIFNTNLVTLNRVDYQRDLTINSDVGSRLTLPLESSRVVQSSFSVGADLKEYDLTTTKTNDYEQIVGTIDKISNPNQWRTNYDTRLISSAQPTVHQVLQYLPLTPRYTFSLRDSRGSTTASLGLNANLWHSGSRSNLQQITGSDDSTGYWVIVNPTVSRELVLVTNWPLTLTSSGQWSSEPLISNEQFGVGGLGSVRGYHEGESFGNDGWWLSAEQKTPAAVVGQVYGNNMLVVRGSVYTGYGQTFTEYGHEDLWGGGFGAAATVGRSWEAKLFCSWPFLSTSSTEALQPRFDFSISAQF